MLSDPAVERVLVFTRTKHGADKVVRSLAAGGIAAAAIHGNKSQPQRERALAGFKSGHCRVLVATDIAARGIDVDGVTHVINYDLPNVPESYVHRIGRTARAGAAGIAISFCNGEERAYLRDIEKLTRMKVPVAALPKGIAALPAEPVRAEPSHHRPGRPQQQRQGQRPAQGQGRGGQGRSAHGQGNGNGRSQGNGHGRAAGRSRQRQRPGARAAAGGGPPAAAQQPSAARPRPAAASGRRSAPRRGQGASAATAIGKSAWLGTDASRRCGATRCRAAASKHGRSTRQQVVLGSFGRTERLGVFSDTGRPRRAGRRP